MEWEFYVSCGGRPGRVWEEARRYGLINAGGGTRYSQTLELPAPGDLIWVNIPKTGYMGVDRVTEAVQPVKDCTVPTTDGMRPAVEVLKHGAALQAMAENPDKTEWLKTVFPKWVG